MRKFALALSLFVPVVCTAQVEQDQPTYEQILNQTFANMNTRPDVTLVITGTERTGDVSVPFDTTIVWRRSGVGLERAEKISVVKRIDGKTIHEVRANGTTLFSYDFKTRSYSATPYHQIANTRSPEQKDEGYNRRLLTALGRSVSSTGPDSYVARLIQEAMGDAAGQIQVMGAAAPLHYRSWMPGRNPVELQATLPPTTYRDPIVPEQTRQGDVEYGYTPDEKNRYFMYDGSPRRSIVFHVYQPEVNSPLTDYALSRVFFGERSVSAGKNRLVQWTMTVSTAPVLPGDVEAHEAQFKPYTDMRGWRIVANSSAPRG